MGVVSDGGVHGHIQHLISAVEVLAGEGIPVVIHAITDGRDVAPTSAGEFVGQLVRVLPEGARIGTVIGRYWAMDRDKRWDRVKRASDAMLHATGEHAPDAEAAVAAALARGETDEFIAPTVVGDYAGARDGDGFFCLNFRADRAREILAGLAQPGFDAYDTGARPDWSAFLGMVDYSKEHDRFMTTAYPKPVIRNTLGEWVASHGLRQFRIAETEKYPHVTFFLNGGREGAGDGRGSLHGQFAQGRDLRPPTGDVRPRRERPSRRGHRRGL